MNKEDIIKALKEIEKQKDRNFNQSVDFIINLKKFDLKRESINITLTLPHKVKEKKVCAFFEKKSELVDTVTREQFDSYKDKKKLKNLAKNYDFFIANAKLMPAVASTFGRALGPLGKMPSPQAGILPNENDETVKALLERIDRLVKIRTKEASIKLLVGKEEMDNEKIAENALTIYDAVLKELPQKKEQIKSVMIKSTMGKPVKIK